MAQPYSSGVNLVYLGVGGGGGGGGGFSSIGGTPTGGSPVFFGTAEQGADITERPEYEPIYNDYAAKKPFDMMFCGSDALVTLTMTRWNEEVHAAAAAYANPGVGVRGTDESFDRGTIMGLEGKAYQLWVVYPASILNAYSTLPAGYHFRQCILQAPLRLQGGTRPYKISCTFYCWGRFRGGDNFGFDVYDHDCAGLPSPD